MTIKIDRLHLEGGDIDLHQPQGDAVWKRACNVLALMMGLRDLRVVFGLLARNTETLSEWQETGLLLPLMEVRQVRKFVVLVGWHLRFQNLEGRVQSNMPFELKEIAHRTRES